ncbi:MAG: hypothetical protein K2N05_06415 [Muribaculaceae bacterium]|nr:hypothetical protein [Muribaculaceae bacterium]
MLDEIVSAGLNVAEDKLQGTPEQEEKKSAGSKLLRFFISLIWGVVCFLVSMVAVIGIITGKMPGFAEKPIFLVLSIGLCILLSIITFSVPYLRKKGSFTRWCGIVLLGDAIWWIYVICTM